MTQVKVFRAYSVQDVQAEPKNGNSACFMLGKRQRLDFPAIGRLEGKQTLPVVFVNGNRTPEIENQVVYVVTGFDRFQTVYYVHVEDFEYIE